jgi:hypothetical protein
VADLKPDVVADAVAVDGRADHVGDAAGRAHADADAAERPDLVTRPPQHRHQHQRGQHQQQRPRVVQGARAVRQRPVDSHVGRDEQAGEHEERCVSHPSSMPFFSPQR